MRITLSALTFDPLGVVALQCSPTSSLGEQRRRMNRVATLDGGAVFNDAGYSDADLTFALAWQPRSAAQEAAVARLLQLYSQLICTTAQGVYLVAPEVYNPGATEARLTLLVVRKLSQD